MELIEKKKLQYILLKNECVKKRPPMLRHARPRHFRPRHPVARTALAVRGSICSAIRRPSLPAVMVQYAAALPPVLPPGNPSPHPLNLPSGRGTARNAACLQDVLLALRVVQVRVMELRVVWLADFAVGLQPRRCLGETRHHCRSAMG